VAFTKICHRIRIKIPGDGDHRPHFLGILVIFLTGIMVEFIKNLGFNLFSEGISLGPVERKRPNEQQICYNLIGIYADLKS
jgi:hypothetical protein